MRIIQTDEVNFTKLTPFEKLAFYNGMDVLITREVFDNIHPQLDETSMLTYNFMKALQAPIMEMQLRGYLIDKGKCREMIRHIEGELKHLEKMLNYYGEITWGKPLNARSPKQKGEYLYDFAQCKEVKRFDYKEGKSKRTTDRAAIEKLSEKYLKVRPICSCILAIMDLSKQLGTLRSGIDPDGYMRASFMIAGTETGRLASKKNIFGRGTNFQNWREILRIIFTVEDGPIPDRDKYFIPEEYR